MIVPVLGETFAVRARMSSTEQASSPQIVTVGLGSTVNTTVSSAVPQLGVKLLVVVSLRIAVPIPVKVTPEARLLGSSITAGPLTTDQTAVPLAALPAKVNGVVAPAAQVVWSGPAFASGLGFTVRTTKSSTLPQLGVKLLVVVSLRVAVPIPVKVTPEVRLLVSAITAGPLTTDHTAVPLEALPANVNEVEPPVSHRVWSGPAFASGLGFTVRTTVSSAVSQLGVELLVVVSWRVAVPVPVKVTPEVRLLGSSISAGPLTTVHRCVPWSAVPARVNGVVSPAAHRV